VQSTETLCQRPERIAVSPQKRQVKRSSGQSVVTAAVVLSAGDMVWFCCGCNFWFPVAVYANNMKLRQISEKANDFSLD
jgi:uncharacterized protein YcsI (UPF0317 family)